MLEKRKQISNLIFRKFKLDNTALKTFQNNLSIFIFTCSRSRRMPEKNYKTGMGGSQAFNI